MPYSRVDELPPAVRNRYPAACLRVFLSAFNSAAKDPANTEAAAFKIAHAAATKCAS
jgi:cation transport regulator ChaB